MALQLSLCNKSSLPVAPFWRERRTDKHTCIYIITKNILCIIVGYTGISYLAVVMQKGISSHQSETEMFVFKVENLPRSSLKAKTEIL